MSAQSSAPRTPGARWPRPLRPFAEPKYRLITLALTMSLFGGGVWLIAMVGAVFQAGGSPSDLSMIAAGNAVGMIVAVLIGGALADRFKQQWIMIWAEIIRTVAIALVIVSSALGELQLWELAIASLVLGLAEGIFYPAYTALLPRLLRKDLLLAANGIEGMLRPLAHDALGPAVAGIVVAAWNPVAAFWVIGVTQLIAIGCLLGIRSSLDAPVGSGRSGITGFFADIASGFAYVVKTRWLVWSLVYACLVVFVTMGPIEVLVPFAVRDNVGGGETDYAWVLAGYGVGAALGSLLVASTKLPRRYLTITQIAWGLGTLPLIVMGLTSQLWLIVACAVVIGGVFQGAMVIWGTIIQRLIPEQYMGRVSSLDFFVSLLLMPVSMAVAGPLGEAVGFVPVFLFAALIPPVIGVFVVLIARMPQFEIAHPLDVGATPAAPASPAPADDQPAPN